MYVPAFLPPPSHKPHRHPVRYWLEQNLWCNIIILPRFLFRSPLPQPQFVLLGGWWRAWRGIRDLFLPRANRPTVGRPPTEPTQKFWEGRILSPFFGCCCCSKWFSFWELAGWLVATISFYFHLNFLFLLLVIYFAFPYERFLFAREREISNRRQDGELHVGAGVHVCFVGREEGGNEKGFKWDL